MERLKAYVFFTFALALSGRFVLSLDCYACIDVNSQTTACQVEFQEREDFVVPCEKPDAKCIVARVEYSDGEIAIFKRGCANSTMCASLNSINKDTGFKLFAASDCCDTNLCNTGNHGQTLMPWMKATVALTILTVFWTNK